MLTHRHGYTSVGLCWAVELPYISNGFVFLPSEPAGGTKTFKQRQIVQDDGASLQIGAISGVIVSLSET